ncbi:MAG: CBS domain-containing protein [Planctomycetota bacterium]|nr:MAG: CBS domain-containing protein [Planctomycetota bacterium]
MTPSLGSAPVKEFMTPDPERLPHDFSVAEATDFLLERRIGGAPVVGNDGFPMSVVSTTDLLRTVNEELFRREATPGCIAALRARSLGEIVARAPISCEENTPLREACRILSRERVHRLVVTRQGVPVGILSTLDVARAVAALPRPPGPPPAGSAGA